MIDMASDSQPQGLSRQQRSERASKMMDLTKHPCLQEQKLSLKCLDDNNYRKELCRSHFENYKNCMGFWNDVQLDRKRKGIKPHLPLPDEREKIKKEYMMKRHSS